jgi:hypothetical protein
MVAALPFAIMAGAKMFGDLLGQAQQRKQQQRELEYEGLKQGYNTQMQGIQNMGAGQQSTIEDIINQYRSIA